MKTKIFTLAITLFFFSCSTDKKVAESPKKLAAIKSDVLLRSTAYLPFSHPDKIDDVSLTISGKSILEGTAIFQVINEKGEEVHCETFPSQDLIQPDYRTANSSLQEAHIREVVDGFFVVELHRFLEKKNAFVSN